MSVEIDSTPLYNSRIISTYIKFIRNYYSYINISNLLAYAGMEPYQVEDEHHWFTQEQINLFHEKLAKLTNNPNYAREAGRYAASPDTLGLMRSYILGFAGPAKVYEMIGKWTSNMVRSSVFEARRLGRSRIEIVVTPKAGVTEKPFQCENRMGYFEAIAAAFNRKLPVIEHEECIFKGGTRCYYIITWHEIPSERVRTIRKYFFLLFSVIFVGLYLFASTTVWLTFCSLAILTILFLSVRAHEMEKEELTAAIDNLRASSDLLFEKINDNYNNARMVNEVGLALTRQRDIKSILDEVILILEKRLDYDRGMILLVNKDRTRLNFQAGFGYTAQQLSVLKDTSFHLDKAGARGILVVSFYEQRPFLIDDVDSIKPDLSARSIQFAEEMDTKSFICCPIVYVEQSIGVLVVDNLKTKRPLLQSDIDLLMGITPEIGIGIENAKATEAKERQFQSILEVLASSIDARDPMTSGHSERVTEFAVGIANELALKKEYCEMIRVASLLHDYGKIGIEDSILKKQGELTQEEYSQIKTHATKTRQILEKIDFEGVYQQVPEVTRSHHEKFDGSGYPAGLAGEEIPFGSRILAVADVFEAITSKRHYREPMPLGEAFNLLRESKNIHFDPIVVDAFFRYYRKNVQQKEKSYSGDGLPEVRGES
jgi:HD-GYP domain-containing protein (c-di-GMP phosphodiesterase class II)